MMLKDIKLKFKFRYTYNVHDVFIILSIKYESKYVYFFIDLSKGGAIFLPRC